MPPTPAPLQLCLPSSTSVSSGSTWCSTTPAIARAAPLLDLDPVEVKKSIEVSGYGGFLVAQQAARRMLAQGEGAIFFTGASASVKGYAQSAPFAMGKFALRGLAQAMARELQPLGIHVAHFVIDGAVRNAERGRPDDPARPDGLLDPDAVAHSLHGCAQAAAQRLEPGGRSAPWAGALLGNWFGTQSIWW